MHRPTRSSTDSLAAAQWIDAAHPLRALCEDFVSDVYRQRYAATITRFMPQLLAFFASDGRVEAVVGLRCGRNDLFVERYLQRPLHTDIAEAIQAPVAREQIVEIGGFAAESAGSARRLILSLISVLQQSNRRWVSFVATRQLRNSFHRLGLNVHCLQLADAAALGAERSEWGSYYEQHPEVVFGDLAAVARSAAADTPIELPEWLQPRPMRSGLRARVPGSVDCRSAPAFATPVLAWSGR